MALFHFHTFHNLENLLNQAEIQIFSFTSKLSSSSDEQAFNNMSGESEKKYFIVKELFWPVPSQGMVEQAKKHGGFRPQRGYPGEALRPQPKREVTTDAPDKGYN